LSGSIIKRAQVQLAGVAPASATHGQPPAPLPARCATRKSAVLVESAGRPVAIEITCSCGETTLVELEMPNHSAVPGATEERKTT
jgi:hypothetical protein